MINIGIDSSGNYIMTSDDKTKIDILSLRGKTLKLCSQTALNAGFINRYICRHLRCE